MTFELELMRLGGAMRHLETSVELFVSRVTVTKMARRHVGLLKCLALKGLETFPSTRSVSRSGSLSKYVAYRTFLQKYVSLKDLSPYYLQQYLPRKTYLQKQAGCSPDLLCSFCSHLLLLQLSAAVHGPGS